MLLAFPNVLHFVENQELYTCFGVWDANANRSQGALQSQVPASDSMHSESPPAEKWGSLEDPSVMC